MGSCRHEIIDTHAHLDDRRFDGDREDVIRRALSAGVRAMLCVGSDLASSRRAVALAEEGRAAAPR